MKKRNFDRSEQRMRVITQFALWVERERAEVWKTSYAIASALDLTPSSHFRAILNEMVNDGDLIKREAMKSGRWQRFEYTLAPGTYKLPKRRTIALKGKGIAEEQIALW